MTDLNYRQKQILGETRHALDRHAFLDDIAPSAQAEVVQALAAELSSLPPVRVPLRQDDRAVYGWPADGIAAKIGADGGSLQFGWRLREWPEVLLTAEPHAVWVDPDGTLVDITPDVSGGDTSLFVPVVSFPEPFGPERRPPNRYRVLHTPPDRTAAVAERIARMKSSQRAYENRRAGKAGMTLEEWIVGKYHRDPLPAQIAAFIAACDEYDAMLPSLPNLILTEWVDEVDPVEDGFAAPDGSAGELPATEAGSGDDEVAEDLGIDAIEEPFDDTLDAVDSLDQWTQARDRARLAILRSLTGE